MKRIQKYSWAVIWPLAILEGMVTFCWGTRKIYCMLFTYLPLLGSHICCFVHRQKVVVSEYFPFPVTGKMIEEFVCSSCVCVHIYMCVNIISPSKYQHTTVGLIKIPFCTLNMFKLKQHIHQVYIWAHKVLLLFPLLKWKTECGLTFLRMCYTDQTFIIPCFSSSLF